MSEIKITQNSLENAILKDGNFVSGYINQSGTIDASGNGAHAEGYADNGTIDASGNGAHAEGINTRALADGAHAEGYDTQAGDIFYDTKLTVFENGTSLNFKIYGNATDKLAVNDIIKIGSTNTTLNITSVIYQQTDNYTITIVLTSGKNRFVSNGEKIYKFGVVGNYSHAEGQNTLASGTASHAGGIGTIANQEAMTVIGKYNVLNDTQNQLFVVGNGTSTSDSSRSNAFVIKNDGDVLINPFNSSLLISLYDLICRVSPHLIYTSNNNSIVSPSFTGALPNIISNTYSNDYGIMVFDTSCSSIGGSAFLNNNALTSIIIPNSVTSIGNSAFSGCTSLTSIIIPNNVASIGRTAFNNCGSLTTVTIGNSVTSIGEYAFNRCNSLTTVTINSNTIINPNPTTSYSGQNNIGTIFGSQVENYIIGDNVDTSIGEWAFYDCSSLTSVTIGNSVTSIGGSAFSGCIKLTSITIPNSVTSIGDGTFMYCNSLTSATIGNSVTHIEDYAFFGCRSLEFITCEAATPPTCDSSVFDGANDYPIYVPAGSVNVYKSSWPIYASRIYAIS